MRNLYKTLAMAALLSCALPILASQVPTLALRGQIDGSANESYIELPFQVPPGTGRITVAFDYSGREDKTTLDLGLLDPHGLRGWSGGNKRLFTVGLDDATPSYRHGPLPPGEWKLLLGVPNIRAGNVSQYAAELWLTPAANPENLPEVLETRIADLPGWYRGDLHMHTAHSDANCDSQAGVRVPCPLFHSLQAAVEGNLDFVVVTEHNTVSHLQDIRALQSWFDQLLLVPGMEITTFQGHANVFGLHGGLDFRVGGTVPDWNAVLAEAWRRGLPVSVNHPALPSDERCMGCGWRPIGGTDWSQVASIEVVNGADMGTPVSGIPFWHERLNEGHRLVGIGGSDNHDAALRTSSFGRSRIGAPTTVIHANELSQRGILDGLRSGRVYVDVQGSGAHLEMVARHGDQQAWMGNDLSLPANAVLALELQVAGIEDARVEWIVDGQPVRTQVLESDTDAWEWRSERGRHWIRADVRDGSGRLRLVGNPVYLNYPVTAR